MTDNSSPSYLQIVQGASSFQIKIDYETLDLDNCKVTDFKRVLNMKEGYLERSFTAELKRPPQRITGLTIKDMLLLLMK